MPSSLIDPEEELYTVIRWPKGKPTEVQGRAFWANDWTSDPTHVYAWKGCGGLYSAFRVTRMDWGRASHVLQIVTLEYAVEAVTQAAVLSLISPADRTQDERR